MQKAVPEYAELCKGCLRLQARSALRVNRSSLSDNVSALIDDYRSSSSRVTPLPLCGSKLRNPSAWRNLKTSPSWGGSRSGMRDAPLPLARLSSCPSEFGRSLPSCAIQSMVTGSACVNSTMFSSLSCRLQPGFKSNALSRSHGLLLELGSRPAAGPIVHDWFLQTDFPSHQCNLDLSQIIPLLLS